MSSATRWKQRLENFERAFLLLREAFETVFRDISQHYLCAVEQVFTWLKKQALE